MAFFPEASAYPNVARVVRHEVANVPGDPRKFRAFKKYSQLTDEKARRALGTGPDPRIRVSPLPAGTFGHYRAGDVIQLSNVIARQHERLINSWGWAQGQSAGRRKDEHARWLRLVRQAVRVIESTILHEMVHWGDATTDGLTQDREAMRRGWKDVGHRFVHEAYGKRFTYVRETLRGRVTVRAPDLEIQGWIGWDRSGRPFDPWKHATAASGPPHPTF